MCAMRNIRVVAYDPHWVKMFEQEAAQIGAVFGAELVAIYHIESTAVPDLPAKPVIDIMPVVRSIERVERFNAALAQLGYEAQGENGIPGRRFFIKGGDENRSHNLHTYEPAHPEVARHLHFRDYLRAHPEEARGYARLKAALAQQCPDDVFGYMAGKDSFIKQTLQAAQIWAAQQQADLESAGINDEHRP